MLQDLNSTSETKMDYPYVDKNIDNKNLKPGFENNNQYNYWRRNIKKIISELNIPFITIRILFN